MRKRKLSMWFYNSKKLFKKFDDKNYDNSIYFIHKLSKFDVKLSIHTVTILSLFWNVQTPQSSLVKALKEKESSLIFYFNFFFISN